MKLSLPLERFAVSLGVAWFVARVVSVETVTAAPRTKLVSRLLNRPYRGPLTAEEIDVQWIDPIPPAKRGAGWYLAYVLTCPYCTSAYSLAALVAFQGRASIRSRIATWAAGWALLRSFGR